MIKSLIINHHCHITEYQVFDKYIYHPKCSCGWHGKTEANSLGLYYFFGDSETEAFMCWLQTHYMHVCDLAIEVHRVKL